MNNIITKLEVQKKNKDRLNIYVDYEYKYSCNAETAFQEGLKPGVKIDEEKIEKVIEKDNYIKAKSTALKYIAKSMKTKKEIIDKLKLKEYDDQTINKVLDFMIEYDFCNDDRYADCYIKEKQKNMGFNKIKYLLVQKGIKEEIINKFQNDIKENSVDNLLNIAEKRYNIIIKSEEDKGKIYKKLADYLLRKGYAYDEIKKVLSKILN